MSSNADWQLKIRDKELFIFFELNVEPQKLINT